MRGKGYLNRNFGGCVSVFLFLCACFYFSESLLIQNLSTRANAMKENLNLQIEISTKNEKKKSIPTSYIQTETDADIEELQFTKGEGGTERLNVEYKSYGETAVTQKQILQNQISNSEDKQRIAVFFVYTGIPKPIPFQVLESYARNKDLLDLYLVLDWNKERDLSSWIKSRLEALVSDLSFNETGDTNFGWNLCDVRPLFGSIFSNITEKYSNWAWTDTHTYLGDLSSFLTKQVLSEYDIVSFLEPQPGNQLFTSGTFSVFRSKTSKPLWMYQPHAELLQVLIDPKNNQNDEYRFSNAVLRAKGVTMLVQVVNVRSWRDAKYLTFTDGSVKLFTWKRNNHITGSNSNPLPVEVQGRWDKNSSKMIVPVQGFTAFSKDVNANWYLREMKGDPQEVAVAHCRRMPEYCQGVASLNENSTVNLKLCTDMTKH
uniref:Uncharacterized protein n=1 Tax=Aplanochytrium stocchinoi TaxID=215587 RepID=A0A7S3LQA2_9STRA